ncbi:MAG TPA: DUF4143 domain-containing protein [Acidimicrobiales bacterium]
MAISQGEIDGTTDGFVDAIFADASRVGRQEPPELSRKDVFKRVCRGGFPEAVLAANGDARRNFFANYARTITAKDVQELADLEHSASLRTIINLLAARTATELNIADLARELALPAPTIRRYLPLFETIYAHHVIPAWSRNLSARVVHRPKLHMVDTGLAAYLLGVDAAGLSRPTATHAGQLLESPGLRTLFSDGWETSSSPVSYSIAATDRGPSVPGSGRCRSRACGLRRASSPSGR